MAGGGLERLPAALTPTVLGCFVITAAIHAAVYLLNALLPIHLVALGGSKVQVGMLFSVSTVASMLLRPLVGGWNDRWGFRRVVVPGVALLMLTLLALHRARAPMAVIALMAGLGASNGLISTSAGVLVARVSAPARRGETLSLYYVATSLGFALGPPAGFALYRAGGMALDLLAATGLALLIGLVAWALGAGPARAPSADRPRFRWYSRPAAPAASVVLLANIGHSSIYAFLPLHAMAAGMTGDVGWFYALFSAWLIACRIGLRRASDRMGRPRVLAPAMGLIALAYLTLAMAPSTLSLAAAAVLLATGVSVFYPTLLALVVDRAPEAERGLAVGTLSGSFDLGVVVGSLLIGSTVEWTSYAGGFALAGAAALAALGVFLVVERAHARRDLPGLSAGV